MFPFRTASTRNVVSILTAGMGFGLFAVPRWIPGMIVLTLVSTTWIGVAMTIRSAFAVSSSYGQCWIGLAEITSPRTSKISMVATSLIV